ncbi:MAG TPA: hypothetical protein VI953_03290 [Candidatus Paceibacterota bacterium]
MAFKTEVVTHTSGTLSDLEAFRETTANDQGYAGGNPVPMVLNEARAALAGKILNINPPCRIPAADNGKDLFFNNRELLVRWATMSTNIQEGLLYLIREAMISADTREVRIEVLWAGEKTKRTLKCWVLSLDDPHKSHMDIDLI